jgi:hypothetical protein
VAKTDPEIGPVESLAKEKALTDQSRCYTNKHVPTILAGKENTQHMELNPMTIILILVILAGIVFLVMRRRGR